MFNDSPAPKVSSYAERLQQLSQLGCEIRLPFFARNSEAPSIWDIANSVCDQHDVLLMC
jgi:hypothetical protein